MTSTSAIDAGEDELRAAMGTLKPGPHFDYRKVATSIYEAMAAWEPRPKTISTLALKLDTGELQQQQLRQFSEDVAAFKSIVESAADVRCES